MPTEGFSKETSIELVVIRWMVAKSCTTLDGWKPINNGINHRFQLVIRISLAHPQYQLPTDTVESIGSCPVRQGHRIPSVMFTIILHLSFSSAYGHSYASKTLCIYIIYHYIYIYIILYHFISLYIIIYHYYISLLYIMIHDISWYFIITLYIIIYIIIYHYISLYIIIY